MQPFSDAVTEVTRSIDPKYLKEGEQVLVGFDGPFVSRRVTPRDLLSQFIGSMVCVEGIVTKCNVFLLHFLFSVVQLVGHIGTNLRIATVFSGVVELKEVDKMNSVGFRLCFLAVK